MQLAMRIPKESYTVDYAGFWIRLAAYVIDALILVGIIRLFKADNQVRVGSDLQRSHNSIQGPWIYLCSSAGSLDLLRQKKISPFFNPVLF